MGNLQLSVVLCTHNGEAYLGQQLESLLTQVRPPDQIVMADDASTDGTLPLLRDFAETARRRSIGVKLIERASNLGFVRNFSDAMAYADGDLIFLCDQDDQWHPDKLAVMEARFAVRPDLLMLWSNARLVDAAGRSHHSTLFEALELRDSERQAVAAGRAFEVLLRRSMATGATAAFRRDMLSLALPVGEGWIHDEWLAIVFSALGHVGMLDQTLIDYRQHQANQVGMRKRSMAEKWRGLVGSWGEQFQCEVVRLRSLQQHLEQLDGRVDPQDLCLVSARREHVLRRAAMGKSSRWMRLPAICREAIRGDYRRFGTGQRSMLRDLLRHD